MSFRYCVYILSRNREKQLFNKAIKSQEAILKACAYKKHYNAICDSNREPAENCFISEFQLIRTDI